MSIFSSPPLTDIDVNIGLNDSSCEFKKMAEELTELRERYALLIRRTEAREIGQKPAQELEATKENHAHLLAKDNACNFPPIQGIRFSVNGVRLVHRVTPMMVRHQSHTEVIEDADTTLVDSDDGEEPEKKIIFV